MEKMKEVMTPSEEITLETNAVNGNPSGMNKTSNAINENDEADHAVPILSTVFQSE